MQAIARFANMQPTLAETITQDPYLIVGPLNHNQCESSIETAGRVDAPAVESSQHNSRI